MITIFCDQINRYLVGLVHIPIKVVSDGYDKDVLLYASPGIEQDPELQTDKTKRTPEITDCVPRRRLDLIRARKLNGTETWMVIVL